MGMSVIGVKDAAVAVLSLQFGVSSVQELSVY